MTVSPVQERSDHRHCLVEPIESFPGTGAEVDSVRQVFPLEPASTQPQYRTSAAEMIDCCCHLGHQGGVTKGDR